MIFWYWSGSEDPYLWITDPAPDPHIFVSDLQDGKKKISCLPILAYYRYLLKVVHLHNFSKIKSPKVVTKQWETRFFLLILLDDRSGSGSATLVWTFLQFYLLIFSCQRKFLHLFYARKKKLGVNEKLFFRRTFNILEFCYESEVIKISDLHWTGSLCTVTLPHNLMKFEGKLGRGGGTGGINNLLDSQDNSSKSWHLTRWPVKCRKLTYSITKNLLYYWQWAGILTSWLKTKIFT